MVIRAEVKSTVPAMGPKTASGEIFDHRICMGNSNSIPAPDILLLKNSDRKKAKIASERNSGVGLMIGGIKIAHKPADVKAAVQWVLFLTAECKIATSIRDIIRCLMKNNAKIGSLNIPVNTENNQKGRVNVDRLLVEIRSWPILCHKNTIMSELLKFAVNSMEIGIRKIPMREIAIICECHLLIST